MLAPMKLFVRKLEFYAFHGATDAEQTIGHRYEMDLEVRLRTNSGTNDDLGSTVDYGMLATRAEQAATAQQHRLLEKVAFEVAQTLIAEFPMIISITVRLSKRLPPCEIMAKSAGVEYSLELPERAL